MKIALVTDTYLPRINGVAVSVDTLADELGKRGHEVHIYAPAYPGHRDLSPSIHRFPSRRLWPNTEERAALPWDRCAAESFLRERFDLVHTHTPFALGVAALRWARRTDAAVVHSYHTVFSRYARYYLRLMPEPLALKMVSWISRRYCNASDLVVTPSDVLRDELLRYGIHTPIEVIRTGVDLQSFERGNRARFRQAHGVPPDQPCLLYVGRLAAEKNLELLPQVLQRLRGDFADIRLFIAGFGPAEPSLRDAAARLGVADRVTFLGYLRGQSLADCYAAADVFVFPSLTESQGLVVSEALVAGTPVVAVGAMGVKESLPDEQGGLLTEPDAASFASAVKRLLADPALYARKQQECRQQAEQCSSATMAQRMLELYESALERRAALSPCPAAQTRSL